MKDIGADAIVRVPDDAIIKRRIRRVKRRLRGFQKEPATAEEIQWKRLDC